MNDFEPRKYTWSNVHIGVTLTGDYLRERLSVRIPDPWWRKPLVWLRILEPRTRETTVFDELARGLAVRSAPDDYQMSCGSREQKATKGEANEG